MIWTTWRQHRLEAAWSLLALVLLAAGVGFIANELRLGACSGPGVAYCFPDDAAGSLARSIVGFNLFQYALVVFPALAGAFIGAPLVAREVENGTHRLAWTQGVTRTRWVSVKVALVFLPLLLAAAVVGGLEVALINAQSAAANHWALFDQQAPMTVASTAFALAFGLAAGAVVARSVPATAVTLVGFVVVRIGVAEVLRPRYFPPLTVSTQDPSTIGLRNDPTAWWLDRPEYQDASGRVLSDQQIRDIGGQVSYLREHGIFIVQHYQPGDRFWAFQTIESWILVGLALALLGFAVYWVTRRVS